MSTEVLDDLWETYLYAARTFSACLTAKCREQAATPLVAARVAIEMEVRREERAACALQHHPDQTQLAAQLGDFAPRPNADLRGTLARLRFDAKRLEHPDE